MDYQTRELLVARISSGSLRCPIVDRRGRQQMFLIKRPSRDQAYFAEELYRDILRESQLDGLYDDTSLYDLLIERGLWDEERQLLLQSIPKEIEEFKFQLWVATFKTNEKKIVRKALEIAKAKQNELYGQRHLLDHFSCSGAASIARTRYLIGCALFTLQGAPVFSTDSFWEEEGSILDLVMDVYMQERLEERQYRELARTEPWRSIWLARKVESSLFGVPAIDFTDEQKGLVSWSSLYDNIMQHPSCPPEEIMADDDVLDGWMIEQRRSRENETDKRRAEQLLGNDKIKNSQEVFVVVDTPEDAHRIDKLNDPQAAHVKRQRFAALRAKGEINEIDMPDTRQRLIIEANNHIASLPK